jgi:RNA polymerase sigma-70 factor (ECF subfamily)
MIQKDAPRPSDFDDVYAQNVEFVWRCLRALGVREAAVDDAAQDVFLTVHRRLASFRGDGPLRGWLFGIARNVAFHHQRGARRKGSGHDPLSMELPSAGPSPLEQAEDAEAGAFVMSFVASLPPKRRDVFILASLEQLSIPEVATALSIPVNTAYTRLRAARAEFHRALARRRGEP